MSELSDKRKNSVGVSAVYLMVVKFGAFPLIFHVENYGCWVYIFSSVIDSINQPAFHLWQFAGIQPYTAIKLQTCRSETISRLFEKLTHCYFDRKIVLGNQRPKRETPKTKSEGKQVRVSHASKFETGPRIQGPRDFSLNRLNSWPWNPSHLNLHQRESVWLCPWAFPWERPSKSLCLGIKEKDPGTLRLPDDHFSWPCCLH